MSLKVDGYLITKHCEASVRWCKGGVVWLSQEEGRLTRVKRMLTGSLLMGRRPTAFKTFGVHLEDLPVTNEGIPRVVLRMAMFVETYGLQFEGLFRLSGGNPRLVERMKASMDRTGDADLEGCGDVTSVASLLKLWLRDLPEPLVSPAVTAELVTLLHKYRGEPDWCSEAKDVVGGLPARNAHTLKFILRLLHLYNTRHSDKGYLQPLAAVFSPLLLCGEYHGIATPDTTYLTSKLISDYKYIFCDKELDYTSSSGFNSSDIQLYQTKQSVSKLSESGNKQRKRKDRQGNDAQSVDRKFVRSNSEERPCVEEKKTNSKESMRRVSSHEDFSKTRHASRQNNCLMELITEAAANNENLNVHEPLHERNTTVLSARNNSGNKLRNNNNNNIENVIKQTNSRPELSLIANISSDIIPVSTVGYARELIDENEYERRRHSERFAPQRGHRNVARRRKSLVKFQKPSSDDTDGGGSSSKENEEEQTKPTSRPQAPLSEDENSLSDTPGSLSRSTSSSSSSPSFLQLHGQERDRSVSPRDRSVSPVPPPSTPPLDFTSIHEHEQPLTSLQNWSFAHRQPEPEDRMVSPRNSIVMTRRVFAENPEVACPHAESKLTEITKQIQSIKRKLKRYEEGFEQEFGYRPSHADKMANPDTKKMCSLLSKLRKEVKTLKEEGSIVVSRFFQSDKPAVTNTIQVKNSLTLDAVQDIEKKLNDKRHCGSRPESLEDMNRDQLVDEKVAVQKGLLYLENTFGRPSSKDERDIVRPLYDRYRLLKRLLARNAPSKLKDSVSELGTILEHETMDFTSASPPPAPSPSPSLTTCLATTTPTPPVEVPSRPNTPDLENLHSLPVHQLIIQQRITREEKKRLRRSLREFEEECQNRIGRKLLREDRLPMEEIYTEYKHAKAKLRLLEALLAKKN